MMTADDDDDDFTKKKYFFGLSHQSKRELKELEEGIFLSLQNIKLLKLITSCPASQHWTKNIENNFSRQFFIIRPVLYARMYFECYYSRTLLAHARMRGKEREWESAWDGRATKDYGWFSTVGGVIAARERMRMRQSADAHVLNISRRIILKSFSL